MKMTVMWRISELLLFGFCFHTAIAEKSKIYAVLSVWWIILAVIDAIEFRR